MEYREYKEHDQFLQGAVIRFIEEKKLFFEQKINFHGHFMTEYKAHQIMSRWKYVTQLYKAAKRNNNRSGAAPQTCKFFEELDELLREMPNITPVVTLGSRSGLSLAVKPKATSTSSSTSGAFETSVVSPPEANLEDGTETRRCQEAGRGHIGCSREKCCSHSRCGLCHSLLGRSW